MHIIYFDVGTTNMRGYLLNNLEISDTVKHAVGSRDSSKAHDSGVMISGMKMLWDELLDRSGLRDAQITAVYASGMASSQFGLSAIEHLFVPVGRTELACHMIPVWEDNYFHREIICVPGVKTGTAVCPIDLANIHHVNNMRGEEIEIVGIIPQLADRYSDFALVMPGSHTHLSHIQNGKITDILSCMSGELYQAISRETVLSGPLGTSDGLLDKALVLDGCNTLSDFGFNRAIYTAHSMNVFNAATPSQIASFTEGVLNGGIALLLADALHSCWNSCEAVVVAGSGRLTDVTLLLAGAICKNVPIEHVKPPDDSSFAVQGLLELLKEKEEG